MPQKDNNGGNQTYGGKQNKIYYDDGVFPPPADAPAQRSGKIPDQKAPGMNYAENAAIDGVRYFVGSLTGFPSGTRLFWGLTFLTSLITGIVIFHPIWQSFMNKATLNLQETVQRSEFEFPAITFCNFNMWKRSVTGHEYATYMRMDNQFRHDSAKYGKSVCGAEPFYKTVSSFADNTTWFDNTFETPTTLANAFGYHMLLLDTPTSFATVQSCIFKGKALTDFECYSAFQNRFISDNRVCFTFNPSDSIRGFSSRQINENFPGDKSSNYDLLKHIIQDYMYSTFPAPLPGVIDFKVKANGPATAVELLLNVQQYEYCSTGSTDGAGIEVLVHSRDVQPLISGLMNNVVKLSPGKDITLVIGEEHTIRETESAGWYIPGHRLPCNSYASFRCSSKVPLKYYEHLETYDRDACFTECLTDKIVQRCNCFPVFIPLVAMRQRFTQLTKQIKNPYKMLAAFTAAFCMSNGTECQERESQVLLRDRSIVLECSQCKVPCFERTYRVGKTEATFPASNNFPIYQDMKYPKINYTALRQLTTSYNFTGASYALQMLDKRTYGEAERFQNNEEVQQNLIHLRIQLKSMEVVVQRVKFAVSVSELITQFGGTISLFIGASMLSFVEIAYWCFLAVHNLFKRK